ncbi:transmembrane protein 171-like [Mixophyes fleayi]|uniref:transmembrane protein 171-like n=1 Tax=Mixophyes fleayi TaxID=3061075 RepID=UPI003F4DF880
MVLCSCGYSRTFFLFGIFGLLLLICGVLMCIVGAWVPGCTLKNSGKGRNDHICDPLQKTGPVVILIAAGLLVAAHIKRRRNTQERDETGSAVEARRPANQTVSITVGERVFIFPPPPPSYFCDPLSPAEGQDVRNSTWNDDDPQSYDSLFNISRKFFLFGIFGLLLLICGVLMCIVGAWVPGCTLKNSGIGRNDHICDPLQKTGPVVILIAAGFLVAAHIKRRRNVQERDETVSAVEARRPANQTVSITVGERVFIFPPPPPSYFCDPLSPAEGQDVRNSTWNDDDPQSYDSLFNIRMLHTGDDSIYTIPLPIPTAEAIPSDAPPKYEERSWYM